MSDAELWTHLHKMLENCLVEMRDLRTSWPFVGNGLVVRERDGASSDVIRIPTREAVRMVVEEYRRLREAGQVL